MPTIEQAKTWYDQGDAVHNFEHVLRVYRLAERLAESESADLGIVRAAVLLHDAEGSHPADESKRADHHEISAEFAGQVLADEGWPAERIAAVQHCIRAHRYRKGLAAESLEAKILFDADKLDAIGAIGVARALAYATLAGQPFFTQPSAHFLNTLEKEPGEAHSAYHEFLFKLSRIQDRLYTESAKTLAAGRHEFMRQFFEQLGAEIAGER